MRLRRSRYLTESPLAMISAVRGPDNEALAPIKEMLTWRVRHVVFHGPRPPRVLPLTCNDAALLDRLLDGPARIGESHYLDHLARAIRASRQHPVWGGREIATRVIDALERRIFWLEDEGLAATR